MVKRSDSGNLFSPDTLVKNFRVWFFGTAPAFPLYKLILLINYHRKNKNNIETSWDQNFNVHQNENSQFRFVLSIIAGVIFTFAMVVLFKV